VVSLGAAGRDLGGRPCPVKTVGVTACEHDETEAMVLTHVNGLGLPSAKSSP
jgi:hypothetical protein